LWWFRADDRAIAVAWIQHARWLGELARRWSMAPTYGPRRDLFYGEWIANGRPDGPPEA
jgi:hypothetical protein